MSACEDSNYQLGEGQPSMRNQAGRKKRLALERLSTKIPPPAEKETSS